MKITEIETIPLRLPFAQPFKISQGADREALETLIVRVHTDEGIVGIGETQAWRRQGSAELLWNLVRTVKDHFEPRVAGRSPFDVAGILKTLNETLYNTFYAQAAVADALYDIAARVCWNVPRVLTLEWLRRANAGARRGRKASDLDGYPVFLCEEINDGTQWRFWCPGARRITCTARSTAIAWRIASIAARRSTLVGTTFAARRIALLSPTFAAAG